MLSNNLANRLKNRVRSLSVFEGLMVNDKKLVEAGFPPMSEWWKSVFKDFYQSGKLRLVARVGRRGGKSTMICRIAVAEVLYGDHVVPPGDIGVFVIISVRKDEAKERLRTIQEILKALGVKHSVSGMEITLKVKGKPFSFRVYPANFRATVGMTCIGWVGDEMTRWRDDSDSANPATDIIGSIRPAMATMPNAHEFYISSPWARMDAHYNYFEKGNTEEQAVCWAESWVANPTLTENRCRRLEPDEPTFEREYRAIPMDNDSRQFFDEASINEAMDKRIDLPIEPTPGVEVVAGADFAFVHDSSAIVVAHIADKKHNIADIDVLKPQRGKPLVPSHVCARFANILNRHQAKLLMADAHYREAISEFLQKKNIGFLKAPARPINAYIRARTLLNQGRVVMPYDEKLKKEMLEIKGRPTPSGNISIVLPKKEHGGHADVVSALVLALYQRKGRVVKDQYRHGRPKGWTKEELEEVKAIEEELTRTKTGIKPYITRL